MNHISPSRSLFAGTAIVGGLTALSRLLGFVRDLLIARLLGASVGADIFFLAFRIPNTLRSFFAEGALTSAFIPIFAEELERDIAGAQKFYHRVLGVMLFLTLCVIFIFFCASETVVSFFAPGFSENPQTLSQAAHLLRIMLPYLPSITVVVIINGVLTSLHRYGAGAIAQVIVNLCIITGALLAGLAPSESHVIVLAWAVLGAALVQYLVLFPLARSAGFPPIPHFSLSAFTTRPVKRMFLLMIPALLGAAVYQLTILLNTLLASFLATGSIAWLFYADRIAQLPIGVFTIALSSVLLPHLARGYARGDDTESSKTLASALRYSIFFLCPLAIGISLAAETIIGTVFQHGAFSADDTIQAARALKWYGLGLLPLSLYSVLSRHFIAKKQTVIPAIIGSIALASSFLISLSTMGEIQHGQGTGIALLMSNIQQFLPFTLSLGHEGLALSSASCALLSLLLAIFFMRSHERSSVLGLLKESWKPVVGAVIAGIVISFVESALSTSTPVVRLSAAITVSSMSYLIVVFFLRSEEFLETFSAISRYRRR